MTMQANHRMVPHRPKDGHPPTNLRMVTHHQKEVYYRLGIWSRDSRGYFYGS